MRTIRIFISSPGDVAEEREKARQIIAQLQKRYAGQLQLVPVLWEDLPLGLDVSFQQGIDVLLSASQGIDIAVFIIWSRLGSPIGSQIVRPDGTQYRSGTDRELDVMLAARRASGGKRPALLAYVRDDADSFQSRMKGLATEEIREMIEQKEAAERFVQEQFHDSATGTNVRAYHAYDKPIEYAHRLRVHLQGLLDDLIHDQPGVVRWEGPPFRGLEVFDVAHSAIFFGREQEVADVLLKLHARAKSGCGSVIIAGASGAGKSSLVRAGVIPALVHANLDDDTAEWRHLILRPGEAADDLLLGLVRALREPAALPELADRLECPEDLATSLAESPASAYRLIIAPALRVYDQDDRPARLLIVIDQLEELFTHAAGGAARADKFLRALRELAETDRVRVIATVRSDYYAQCQANPDLMLLKAGDGLYDLLPPRPAALQQMIARPAAMAGLRFEEHPATGKSLDLAILNDASEHPEALPLLQYCLHELHSQLGPDRTLTFARYDAIGGVTGALSRRAEQVFGELSPVGQEALTSVLNQLVSVSAATSGAGDRTIARRRARRESLTSTPGQRELVDRFVSERLFTSDRGPDNSPVVSVAHEALLFAWDRASRWIEANRDFLAAREVLQQSQERWRQQGGSADFLIPPGKPLEDARALRSVFGDRLLPDELEYIDASIRHHDRRQSRQLRRSRIAAAVFLVLALLACVVGALAWSQKNRAVIAEATAVRANVELEEQLYENRIAVAERELTTHQDIDLASSLLDSCPPALRGWEWHYLMRLRDGERQPLAGHTKGLWTAGFSPDSARVVTASIDGTARQWDAATGTLISTFDRHNVLSQTARLVMEVPDALVKTAVYSPDGRFIASGSVTPTITRPTFDQPIPKLDIRNSTGTILIWDAKTREVVRQFDGQVGITLALTYSPDGRYIASSSINREHTFVVWEAATGKIVKVVSGHAGHVYALAYSPDGTRLFTGGIDGSIKVWDARTLDMLHSIAAHPAPVMSLAFAPGGVPELASAGQDGSIRIWDTNTMAALRVLQGHTGSALSVAYSPDGRRLASAGFDKTVRLWDPKTGRPKITLRRHTDTVWSVAFSADGMRLVSASYDNTAYVWDASPISGPQEMAVVEPKHADRVNGVAFSPDGKLLASSSWDSTVVLTDAESGKAVKSLVGHQGAVWGIAFSKDGNMLASAGWDQTARVWDVRSGQQLFRFDGHDTPVHDVAFTPDGQRIVVSCWDGMIKVWDLKSQRSTLTIDASLFPILGIDLGPDGKRLACAYGDQTVAVWDISTGERLLLIDDAHTAAVYGVAFSPDGKRVVSGGWDGVATVWNVDPAFTGKPAERRVFDLRGHRSGDRVYQVAFSPDGKRIATVGDDKRACIWDANTGRQIGNPFEHRGVIWAVAFSPDGKRIATGAWTRSAWVRTWPVD